MSWQGFTIEPIDVWLFRDGRPFSAGSDVWARSLPMPSPFTLLGALRTFFLLQEGHSPREFHEGKINDTLLHARWGQAGAHPGQLSLRGPFWQKDGELYFPVPADLARSEAGYHILAPLSKGVPSNMPSTLLPLWAQSNSPLQGQSGYLSQSSLEAYLKGNVDTIQVKPLSAFIEKERRTGIKIAKGRTVEEGFFYQTEMLRLKEGVSLYGEAILPDQTRPVEGILFLGGERRMGYLRWAEGASPPQVSAYSLPVNASQIKVILLSPAYFSDGWHPKGGDWTKVSPELEGWQLVSAAVPRLISIGVFAKRNGYPAQKRLLLVPAGAVYFFRSKGDDRNFPKIDSFTEEPPEEDPPLPLKSLGFGLPSITSWQYV